MSSIGAVACVALEQKMNLAKLYYHRPAEIQEKIRRVFEDISKTHISRWYYNGSSTYNLCHVDGHRLIAQIIINAPEDQTEFYALDIGAGNFEWCHAVASFVNRLEYFPKNGKVHIIGVRGEKFFGDKLIETDRSIIYQLGAFKIEELFGAFKEHHLELENKLDLIVSRWTFRHLVDPLGAFLQSYDLLRKDGFICFDGFAILEQNESFSTANLGYNMAAVIADIEAPFLMRSTDDRTLHQFIMKKTKMEYKIPLTYLELECLGPVSYSQIESKTVTKFTRLEPAKKIRFPIGFPRVLLGAKELYDFLQQHGLLISTNQGWQPLQEKDEHAQYPPLHRGVFERDINKVREYLDAGMDPNGRDSLGLRPLHVAIQQGFYEIFQLLLAKECELECKTDFYCHTPLHKAAEFDQEGRFIEALIKKGVNVNSNYDNPDLETPLLVAITARNLKAIGLLIKAGAIISAEDRRLLNPNWLPIHAKSASETNIDLAPNFGPFLNRSSS